jgi:serine phosphatase RsbU (regulator of sigma subunit)
LPANGERAGGDWCEIFALPDEVIVMTVGDVAGHGEEVAGTMTAMRSAIVAAIRESRVPSEVLSLANDVAVTLGMGIVTAIVGFFDCRHRTLTFANAGHPPPLLVTGAAEAFLEHYPADLPLGVFPNYRSADSVIALPPEAMLVFYTDGVTEHDRDPVRGEVELTAAARHAFDHAEADAAKVIAQAVLHTLPSSDDAATIVLRTAFA